VIAGVPLIAELRSGHINHALALNLRAPCSGWFSWPAQRTDGTSTDANCLPEGAHLRIDPTLDLSQIAMPPFTRMLARAAQQYGMIVRDQTGVATGLFMEDPTQYGGESIYSDPTTGLFGGYQIWNLIRANSGFPWDHIQLLKMTACNTAPCAPGPTSNTKH
jgi:hypothetical protein